MSQFGTKDFSPMSINEYRQTICSVGSCDVCGKSFTTAAGLKMHNKMHKGEKAGCPKCPVCGKHFQGSSYLKRHMHVHSSRKAFSCDHCGRSYKYLQTLREHLCSAAGRSHNQEISENYST